MVLSAAPGSHNQIGVIQYFVVSNTRLRYAIRTGGGDERSAKEPVGLTPLRNQGLIEVSSLSGEAEIRSFVDLASRLDDGEARTIAMAINRNWGVATDEKKASRILREVAPKIQIITTPDLVKHWTDIEGISDAEVAVVLRSVHKRGVYRPGRSHPLSGWWDSYFTTSP